MDDLIRRCAYPSSLLTRFCGCSDSASVSLGRKVLNRVIKSGWLSNSRSTAATTISSDNLSQHSIEQMSECQIAANQALRRVQFSGCRNILKPRWHQVRQASRRRETINGASHTAVFCHEWAALLGFSSNRRVGKESSNIKVSPRFSEFENNFNGVLMKYPGMMCVVI